VSFDSLGIAPSLPAGAQVSLSPLLTAMALNRLFGQEFAHLPSKYELMLIFTPSASINYEASGKFIESLPSQIRSRIQLIVCLDDMVSAD